MNFDLLNKTTAMRNAYLLIISIFLSMQSCTSSRELASSGVKEIDPATLENAIKSRRFIVKFDMMHTYQGPMFLRPRSNYLIIDGDKAIIRAAYLGRQYSIRPIAGINFNGRATNFEVVKKEPKEKYRISMEVQNEGALFDVDLTITGSGMVSASVNSLKISSARYSGYLEPITNNDAGLN